MLDIMAGDSLITSSPDVRGIRSYSTLKFWPPALLLCPEFYAGRSKNWVTTISYCDKHLDMLRSYFFLVAAPAPGPWVQPVKPRVG